MSKIKKIAQALPYVAIGLFLGMAFAAFAQAAPAVAVAQPFPWTAAIQGVVAIIGTILAWLFKLNQDKSTAAGQLSLFGDLIRMKVWDALTPDVQAAIANGDWKSVKDAVVKAVEKALIEECKSDGIKALAKALEVPYSTIVGTVAQFLIEKYVAAHDPSVVSASANLYPVTNVIENVDDPPIAG